MRSVPTHVGVLALLVVVACSREAERRPTGAAPAESARGAATVHDDVRQAEEAWARAIVSADMATLDRLLAPEFVLTTNDTVNPHPPLPRAQWMENLRSGIVRTDSASVSDLDVRGTADSAVARLRFYWRPVYRDTARGEDRSSLEDTWVRRDGRWQVVRRMSLELPQ